MEANSPAKSGEFSDILKELKESINEIKDANRGLSEKVDYIEYTLKQNDVKGENQHQAHGRNYQSQSAFRLNSGPADDIGRTAAVSEQELDINNIQAEFAVIKEALQRVKLPADLMLNDSKQGIKREDQPTLQVVARAARYAEVTLKLLNTFDIDSISEADIKNLYVTQVAQLRYLQDEYASLVVQGKFSRPTSQMIRALQKNTSGLSDSALQNLKLAADISNHDTSVTPQAHQYSAAGGFQSNYRGRGRGFQSNYRGRGRGSNFYRRGQYPRDVFDNFASQQVPYQNTLNG